MIDAVNTSFQAVARERDEVRKFLLRNGGKLAEPVSLVIFSDTGADVQNGSTRDGDALATLLDQKELGLRTITRSQGYWARQSVLRCRSRLFAHLVNTREHDPAES